MARPCRPSARRCAGARRVPRSQAEAHRELPRDEAVSRLHRCHRLAPGHGQRAEPPHTAQRRLSAPDVSQHEARLGRADEIGEVRVGPQLDVIAEPRRLLVCIGVAPQPREQRHVVDDCPLVLVELEVLGDAEREHAVAQHMLHRLPETQVRGERHRRHELSQPHIRSGHGGHGYRTVSRAHQAQAATVSGSSRGSGRLRISRATVRPTGPVRLLAFRLSACRGTQNGEMRRRPFPESARNNRNCGLRLSETWVSDAA